MFIGASAILAFAPGPDNIFVLTQSMVHGGREGIVITLGLCTGLLVHTAIVALGLAAIFRTSFLAFTVLKYLGVAYLLYLAWQSLRATAGAIAASPGSPLGPAQYYRRGIIMNVTNPKVSIFFLAFLPQFAEPARGSMTLQFIVLGALFILVTLLVFGLISLLAGSMGRFFNRSEKGQVYLNRIAAVVFVSLAIKLALTAQQ
jgi:threonine/homoserine/homoserine lactone efflux protein